MIVKEMYYNKTLFDDVLKVETINRSILPEMETIISTSSDGHGVTFIKNNLKPLTIDVGVRVIGESLDDARFLYKDLASLMYTTKLEKLYLRDYPDKYYMATLSGATDVELLVRTGSATLNFYCPDPIAWSDTELIFNISNNTQVLNNGTFRSSSAIAEITIQEATDSVKIECLETGEFVFVENEFSSGDEIIIYLGREGGDVTLNDTSIMEYCHYTSDFFNIPVGVSNIKVTPTNSSAILKLKERWL